MPGANDLSRRHGDTESSELRVLATLCEKMFNEAKTAVADSLRKDHHSPTKQRTKRTNMRHLFIPALLAIVFVESGMCADDSGTAVSAKRPFEEIVFDAEVFLKSLPKKTFVMIPEDEEQKSLIAELISKIDPAGTVEFFALPAEAVLPKFKSTVPPQHPRELKKRRVSGSADFLALIGSDGRFVAVYCYSCTDPAFGVSGAASMLKWRCTPCEVAGTQVPVLVRQSINFKI